MSGLIMFLLIIGVIYIAFTYLKGPRNTDTYRNTFNMGPFNGDTWHGETPPELPENDETEAEVDGEDMEEIGFEAEEAEAAQEYEAPAVKLQGGPAVLDASETLPQDAPAAGLEEVSSIPVIPAAQATPAASTASEASAVPEAVLPVIPPSDGVVIDSEVRIDAVMPSDNNK